MKSLKPTRFFYNNLILICIPLLFLIILRIAGFDGLYGQDSYEYLRYTNAIEDYILTDKHPGPCFWPVLYSTLASLLGLMLGNAFALQLISCLSFSITCIFILKTTQLLYPNAQFRFYYVFLFGLFCPFLLKTGLIVMSDALACVFVILAFYFFFKSYYKNTALTPVFIFTTCAVMSRYPSLIITFPIIIYALYLVIKRKKYKQFIVAATLSLVVTIPFLIFQWGALFEASSNSFLKVWSVSNYFKSSYITEDGAQNYTFPNVIYSFYLFFHPGFIFIGVILSLITLKNFKSLFSFHQKILIFCITLYIFFLAGIPFQNPRVLVLVFPLILILLFPAFTQLMTIKLVKQFVLPIGIICTGLQLTLFTITFKPIYNRTIIEKEIAVLIKPYQGKTLFSFDVDLAMQGRELNFNYKNMFVKRYKSFSKNDLILFNPSRYEIQWKDKTPMLNWEFIKKNYALKVVETHPKGWKLYQIQFHK